MHRFSLRLAAAVVLAGGLSLAMSMGAIAQASPAANPNATTRSSVAPASPNVSPSASTTDWTLTLTFDTGQFTYYLNPLTKAGRTLTGTLDAPACSGAFTGHARSGGHFKIKVADFGSPCSSGFTITLKGVMHAGAGTMSGTFTSNYECAAVCTFTGVRTS